MGAERDKLLRRLGERPLSEENLSDADLVRLYLEYYRKRGDLPPEIAALRPKAKFLS